MPEISDEEYRVLKAAEYWQSTLLKDPRTKRGQEALYKIIKPDTVTTEDLDKPINDRIDAIDKKIEAFIKTRGDRDIDETLEKKFAHLEKQGFTADGITEIKEIMLKKNIADPLDAAAVWEKAHPPEAPPPSSLLPATSWGFGGPDKDSKDEDLKLLFQNEDRWMEREAAKVLDEARRGVLTG